MDILEKIFSNTKLKLEEKKKVIPYKDLEKKERKREYFSFKDSLQKKDQIINLIAEIKKASPSKGLIREDFNIEKIAYCYNKSSFVKAVSILTEEDYFLGSIKYLSLGGEILKKPILRKDFICDEYQILEAYVYGADAILLISTYLKKNELERLYYFARDLGLDVLCEVHDEKDLDKSLEVGVDIVGINNRDLKTFRVDLKTSLKLVKYIPDDKVRVSESGIFTYNDIKLLSEAGFNAILVGESIMRENDIEGKINELFGIS